MAFYSKGYKDEQNVIPLAVRGRQRGSSKKSSSTSSSTQADSSTEASSNEASAASSATTTTPTQAQAQTPTATKSRGTVLIAGTTTSESDPKTGYGGWEATSGIFGVVKRYPCLCFT